MKVLRSIAILFSLLLVSLYSQAQLEVVYPEEDPVRLQEAADRSLRQASVTAPDTLSLPFFEDFTDPDPRPVKKSVIDTVGGPVEITNWTAHHLVNSDYIVVYDVMEHAALNGNFYVKVLSPYTFQLYTDLALSTPFNGNGSTITNLGWDKLPYVNRVGLVVPASPSSINWIQDGGTYINDRYPVEPPSYNVATFDGLNYLGIQYNTSNFNAQGYADNLTSAPIDLENIGTPDSLYLSFFWQCAGIGEAPESNDYLILELKDSLDNWVEVWRMYGSSDVSVSKHFTRANVAIKDSVYFFNGFQFRFKNRGRQSGPFDVWNLDAIYLDTNRYLNDTIKDWAVSRAQHSFLKNYSSMPYKHFFADKANQISVTDSLSIINYSKKVAAYNVLAKMYDVTSGTNVYLSTSNTVQLSAFPDDSWYIYREDADLTMNYTPLVNTNVPRAINLYYYIEHSNDHNDYIYGRNNYYTTTTILWDYYAYDDGTPEYAIKTVASGANVNNQYVLGNSSTDTILTAIDICFTRNAGINMEGRTIFLKVWDNNGQSLPATVLLTQSINVEYPDPYYGFVRYELTSPLALNPLDTFYVGYQQNFTDPLFVGYDGSVDRSDKMYYNDGFGWTRYNQQSGYIPGALMIRPVFENGQILTPVTPPVNDFVSAIYPNPADDIVYLEGEVAEVVIFDLLGRTVLTYSSNLNGNAQHILHTETLTEGLYLVQITSPAGAVKTEKLLIK